MNFGWVKLHRTLVEWEWYGDIITRGIFIHCLIRCNHSDANWRGIEVKKGQFITSYNSLADENGVSIQTTLEKDGGANNQNNKQIYHDNCL